MLLWHSSKIGGAIEAPPLSMVNQWSEPTFAYWNMIGCYTLWCNTSILRSSRTQFRGFQWFNDSTLIPPHIHGHVQEALAPRIYPIPQCPSTPLSSSHPVRWFVINTRDAWWPLVYILFTLFLSVLWTGGDGLSAVFFQFLYILFIYLMFHQLHAWVLFPFFHISFYLY